MRQFYETYEKVSALLTQLSWTQRLSVRKSKLCKTTGSLKISARSATACIPTRSMGTRFFYKTGSLEFTNSIINCQAIFCCP
ncbi:MAG: DUF1016 domain-containing protein [Desulfobacteraceae bacterium]|nr:DUF1016 domain-containing protein [Desulfobacteraceae bacterium]